MILKRRDILSAACAVAIVAGGLAGSNAMAQDDNQKKEPVIINGIGSNHKVMVTSAGFVGTEMSFDANVVKGAPFSAVAETVFTQTLGDGNRIVRRTTAKLYRDSEGRTRREETFSSLNSLATGGPEQQQVVISILDPVNGVSYRLDPNSRTATRMQTLPPSSVDPAQPTAMAENRKKVAGGVLQGMAINKVQPAYPMTAKLAGVDGPVQVQVTISESGDVIEATALSGPELLRDNALDAARKWKFKPTEVETSTGGRPVKAQGVLTFNFTLDKKPPIAVSPPQLASMLAAVPGGDLKQESLGKQTFYGVEAEGMRTVQTIPAGAIGNELPIESRTDRWYSTELGTVVMTRQTDPRFGETVFQLTDIDRTEPAASLFLVPSDYNISDVGLPKKKKLE